VIRQIQSALFNDLFAITGLIDLAGGSHANILDDMILQFDEIFRSVFDSAWRCKPLCC
jgi:hypothetical protein